MSDEFYGAFLTLRGRESEIPIFVGTTTEDCKRAFSVWYANSGYTSIGIRFAPISVSEIKETSNG